MLNETAARPHILLIGANGQVGWELRRTLAPLGQLIAASLDGAWGPRVDLADPRAISKLVRESAPDVVVNAAAYTAVDKAEEEGELARRINAEAPGLLGDLLHGRGVPMVHYSTDFVFSGMFSDEPERPYRENDAPEPLNLYGETKLGGEQALMATGANAIILRTSWVYGVRGSNFLRTMLRLFDERKELRIVDDQIGAPTWSRMLAEVTAQILYRILRGDLDPERVKGIYHATNGGQTSWFDFARAILDISGRRCRLLPIPTREYPAPARRPAYSVLDNTKLRETFGLALPDWQISLRQCLEDLGFCGNQVESDRLFEKS
ncbi:dTDP-4-dehydrorhamnose reductase [Candidatus Thiosymbion oneisti]|uniref:dTDP-4-dehydrorhamnose reductase n=1 Tax=Candidatus Thiosymbion oneisti TaxID=589554 RepID=UPI000AFBA692|nr:dTDP-4-dehydrorhamnose reductase [Candidatus Thiosymbion oneisti]